MKKNPLHIFVKGAYNIRSETLTTGFELQHYVWFIMFQIMTVWKLKVHVILQFNIPLWENTRTCHKTSSEWPFPLYHASSLCKLWGVLFTGLALGPVCLWCPTLCYHKCSFGLLMYSFLDVSYIYLSNEISLVVVKKECDFSKMIFVIPSSMFFFVTIINFSLIWHTYLFM